MSVTADLPDAANSKLPFWRTISLSYSFYFEHLGDALRISWLWLLIFIPLTAAASWLQMSWFRSAVADMKSGKSPAMPIELTIFVNASTLAQLLAGCGIAVAWHRLLLLDEHPGLSGGNVISRRLWRYVGMGIAILLIPGLPAFAVIGAIFHWALPHATDAHESAASGNPAIFILVPVAYLAVCFVAVRLCLLLPARAVDDTNLTFKETWALSRGNAWRIFWGLVACSVPPLILAQIALLFLGGYPNATALMNGETPESMIAFGAIFSGYYLLTLPISIGFLSHAFRFLRRA
jgi:hypothetical protein